VSRMLLEFAIVLVQIAAIVLGLWVIRRDAARLLDRPRRWWQKKKKPTKKSSPPWEYLPSPSNECWGPDQVGVHCPSDGQGNHGDCGHA
jgi:hypothetical protein